MNGKGRASCVVAPELLVKRWQESRLYFPQDEHNRCIWLRAAWLQPSAPTALEMRWSRSIAANR
jgi:hypothetical protein